MKSNAQPWVQTRQNGQNLSLPGYFLVTNSGYFDQ